MNNSINTNSVVKAIYQISLDFLQFLQTEPEKEEREAYIEQIVRYLDQRDVLISYLQGQDQSSLQFSDSARYTSEEKELGIKIVQYNQMIAERLEEQLGAIEGDLVQIRNKKNNQKKYANPYENVAADGMYFDKRK